VARPALRRPNVQLLKDHAITVWLEFVPLEDVEPPALSNLIVLAMEIAHFAQQHMGVPLLVEDLALKILIVEEILMVVVLVLTMFVFNLNVEQIVNQDLIILVIQLMDAPSVILLLILPILVLKVYPVTQLAK